MVSSLIIMIKHGYPKTQLGPLKTIVYIVCTHMCLCGHVFIYLSFREVLKVAHRKLKGQCFGRIINFAKFLGSNMTNIFLLNKQNVFIRFVSM